MQEKLHQVFRELEVCCYVEVSSSMTHNYKCLRASASAVWQGIRCKTRSEGASPANYALKLRRVPRKKILKKAVWGGGKGRGVAPRQPSRRWQGPLAGLRTSFQGAGGGVEQLIFVWGGKEFRSWSPSFRGPTRRLRRIIPPTQARGNDTVWSDDSMRFTFEAQERRETRWERERETAVLPPSRFRFCKS